MKRQVLVMGAMGFLLFVGTFNWTGCTPKKDLVTQEEAPVEEEVAEEAPREKPAFIQAIEAQVAGKEHLPAEEVFEDIQILKGMPAGRLLPIMRMAFNNSLGVRCDHCHEFNNWSANTKPAKAAAREMWVMTQRINRELLPAIENIESAQPVVNCTTCHRGQIKPATSL